MTSSGWRIIELNGRGHRLWYVSLLLRRILQTESRPQVELVTRPETVKLPHWAEHVEPWREAIALDVTTGDDSRLTILRSAARTRTPVVIPDGDMWLPHLVLARFMSRAPISGSILIMRSRPDATRSSQLRHVWKSMLQFMVRVLHPGLQLNFLVAAARTGKGEVLDPVEFSPGKEGREQWLKRHDVDPGVRWLVVLGEINERKCIDLLIEAVTTEEATQAGWGLLALGLAPPPVEQKLAEASSRNPGRVLHRSGFLSDSDFDSWVANADVVSVLYTNEGSSGVLLKCWASGTAVIAGGSQSVLDAALKLDMNWVAAETLSLTGVLQAMSKVIELPEPVADESPWRERSIDFADRLLKLS